MFKTMIFVGGQTVCAQFSKLWHFRLLTVDLTMIRWWVFNSERENKCGLSIPIQSRKQITNVVENSDNLDTSIYTMLLNNRKSSLSDNQHGELEPGKGQPTVESQHTSALFLDEVMDDLRLMIYSTEWSKLWSTRIVKHFDEDYESILSWCCLQGGINVYLKLEYVQNMSIRWSKVKDDWRPRGSLQALVCSVLPSYWDIASDVRWWIL